MPLYRVLIVDLAKGRGVAAKLFSLLGIRQLGETIFSVFIWQNMIMLFCWMSVSVAPEIGRYQVYGAVLITVIVAIISTYWLEKPIAKRLQARRLKNAG